MGGGPAAGPGTRESNPEPESAKVPTRADHRRVLTMALTVLTRQAEVCATMHLLAL